MGTDTPMTIQPGTTSQVSFDRPGVLIVLDPDNRRVPFNFGFSKNGVPIARWKMNLQAGVYYVKNTFINRAMYAYPLEGVDEIDEASDPYLTYILPSLILSNHVTGAWGFSDATPGCAVPPGATTMRLAIRTPVGAGPMPTSISQIVLTYYQDAAHTIPIIGGYLPTFSALHITVPVVSPFWTLAGVTYWNAAIAIDQQMVAALMYDRRVNAVPTLHLWACEYEATGAALIPVSTSVWWVVPGGVVPMLQGLAWVGKFAASIYAEYANDANVLYMDAAWKPNMRYSNQAFPTKVPTSVLQTGAGAIDTGGTKQGYCDGGVIDMPTADAMDLMLSNNSGVAGQIVTTYGIKLIASEAGVIA